MKQRIAVVIAAVGLLAACAATAAVRQPPAAPAAEQNPLAGQRLYTSPDSHALQAVRALRAAGDQRAADRLSRLADPPTAVWFTGSKTDPGRDAAALTRRASAAGRVAVLTAYNLPERDCGQYSSGGAASPEAYRTWLTGLAKGIGNRASVVILEPDAIPHALVGCGGTQSADDRYRLLAWAVGTLRTHAPRAHVYLDAGNASWVTDLPALADALRRSGVADAAGFALNVSNFNTTQRSASYGYQLSDLLGRARFVIDTSRNGNGPPPAAEQGDGQWCNPPGRALGTAPTTRSNIDRVDALLWVKQPGDSDGTCRGGPPAGTWWPAYADSLLG